LGDTVPQKKNFQKSKLPFLDERYTSFQKGNFDFLEFFCGTVSPKKEMIDKARDLAGVSK
jgi:hypothetical protein